MAGTLNSDWSQIVFSGQRGAGMQKPRERPIWPRHCWLSRLELDHGTFQLPGALQMKESSKHDNKRKLGRRIPREGGTGAGTECVQTLRSQCSPSPTPAGAALALPPHVLTCGSLLLRSPTWQATILAPHFTSEKGSNVSSRHGKGLEAKWAAG